MITQNGLDQQLKLLAGKANRFADVFAVGISDAVLTTAATELDFSWGTAQITGTYVDTDLQQVVFYGTLPPDLVGDIKEIGLLSLNDDFIKSGLPNVLVYSFDTNEQWVTDADYTISNESSIGLSNYKFDDILEDQYLFKATNGIDVSRYDTLKLKLNATAVTVIRVIVKTDESNYAYKDITLGAGANLLTHSLSTFTSVGNFDRRSIAEIRIQIQTVTNATNSIEFDALTLISQANGGLVARHVLSTTMYKRSGASMEVELAVAYD